MENKKPKFEKSFNVGDVPVLVIRRNIMRDKDTGELMVLPNRANIKTVDTEYLSLIHI